MTSHCICSSTMFTCLPVWKKEKRGICRKRYLTEKMKRTSRFLKHDAFLYGRSSSSGLKTTWLPLQAEISQNPSTINSELKKHRALVYKQTSCLINQKACPLAIRRMFLLKQHMLRFDKVPQRTTFIKALIQAFIFSTAISQARETT